MFCAYCGSPLAESSGAFNARDIASEANTDPERTGTMPLSLLTDTVEYQPSPTRKGTAVAEEIPARIAGYRLIRRLGSGGMGTVFEAEDEAQGQRVAIKLIGRDHVSSSEAVERFRQEGRLASAVTHPRCVFVLAVDDHEGRPYIVMELMPGSTLQTLVEKSGPLDPATAIVRVFDVIEGLQEFHKRGLIHRDVKPSNCFLEKEGRVKIGDFGLSKALDGGADLTQSGTFIGTPLYASPEQIKRDNVDERTDVYSVAATLYYLLTGHPPVQAKDAAEAMARIASEPAPHLRGHRTDLPRALEAVIHRGLERDPSRRWRSLHEFHDALVPFVPDRLSIAGIGRRVGAYLTDLCLWYLLSWSVFTVILLYHELQFMEALQFQNRNREFLAWFERAIWLLYFGLLEGIGGASLGKWLFGLRVTRTDRGGPPGLIRGVLRILVFYALTQLPSDVAAELTPLPRGPQMFLKYLAYDWLFQGLGVLAIVSTMRERTNFRGPHEWLSGTRVVYVQRKRRIRPTRKLQVLADSRLASGVHSPAPATFSQVGPYSVKGTVRSEPDHKIFLGEDSTLERPVWIVVRDPDAYPPSAARRALNRRDRPRWIGGGDEPFGRWDAFTAPLGFPLTDMVKAEGLTWTEVLPLLRELSEELEISLAEGTLPRRLSPEQVWIQSDGGIQLIDILDTVLADPVRGEMTRASDVPARESDTGSTSGSTDTNRDEQQALAFVGEVARRALEGHHHRDGFPALARAAVLEKRWKPAIGSWKELTTTGRARRIQAAVPERAGFTLDRLTGVRRPFTSVASLRADLDAAASRPMEVSQLRRGVHLAIQGFFLLIGLTLMLALSSEWIRPRAFSWDLETLVAIPTIWIIWVMITRGGLSLPLAGIALVRTNGLPASRRACGFRALLVWAPPATLLVASRYLRESNPEAAWISTWLWMGAVALMACYIALAILNPSRCLHDRLAGTVLVPR
jgi:hypothetical protein